jgi:hypothetical protein
MHHLFVATAVCAHKHRALPRPGKKTTHCLGAFATKAAFITGVNNEHHSNDEAENATAC